MSKINYTPIIITVIIVAAVLGAFLYAFPRESRTVDVTGTAQMTVAPDKAVVYSQVITKGTTADEAKNKNSEVSGKVNSALEAIGISRTDIETENYNIYQDCTYTQEGQKCTGFAASNSIKVSSKDFSNVGKIVDAAVDNGALISYISFDLSLEKQNEYKKTVLANAAQDAKSKAEALAAGLGKKVGKLVSVSSSDYNYGPYYFARAESAGAPIAKDIATNIQPKNLEVTASVSVMYEIS